MWHDGQHNGNGKHRQTDPAPTRPKPTYTSADKAIKAATPRGGKLAGVWSYPGDSMRVARFDIPRPGDKEFRPVHPLDNGVWVIGDPPGMLPLYRGDELPSDGPIVVVEGEKCADLVHKLGLTAVTSAHGSAAAQKSDWTPLAGRIVWIFPDNDTPGEKYAQDVAKILIGLGCKVKIIHLPNPPPGGDIEQFDAAIGGTPEATRAEIERLANAAPLVNAAGPVLVCMADVEPRSIEWIWPQRIPAGRITLLVGRPGIGKSFFSCDLAARVTRGKPWPDGRGNAPLGDVLIISAEDDPHDTTRPRLDACGADVNRVYHFTAVQWINSDGKTSERMFTLEDVNNLELALRRIPSLKLVIIDPIGSYIGGNIDSDKDNKVRSVLAPVARLAEHYGASILIVAHRRKAGGDTADDTALGSRAFTGIARAVWHLSRDSQNKARRLLLPGKQNLSEEPDGLAFVIAGDPPQVQWEADPVWMNADDALVDERTPGPEPEKLEAATTLLREILAAGEVESKDVEKQAKDARVALRTLRRAAEKIGVIKEKNGFSGRWQWRLPKPGNQLGQADGQHKSLGQLGQDGQHAGKTE